MKISAAKGNVLSYEININRMQLTYLIVFVFQKISKECFSVNDVKGLLHPKMKILS